MRPERCAVRLAWLLVAALAAGCSATRVAYENAGVVLRFRAWRYCDLDRAQYQQLGRTLERLQTWHRTNELPVYAALAREAAQRLERGLRPEDVAWAIAVARERYRRLAARLAAQVAPVAATLTERQIAVLEANLARERAEYADEYLPADPRRREQAQMRRALEYFRDWLGPLTAEQQARIARFVHAHLRYAELRLDDRARWQQEAVRLIRRERDPAALAPELAALFTSPQSRRSEEFAREQARWEEDFAQLLIALDRTLSPRQRSHAVERLERYAGDFAALARENPMALEERAL